LWRGYIRIKHPALGAVKHRVECCVVPVKIHPRARPMASMWLANEGERVPAPCANPFLERSFSVEVVNLDCAATSSIACRWK
jgi:hypothetical protein